MVRLMKQAVRRIIMFALSLLVLSTSIIQAVYADTMNTVSGQITDGYGNPISGMRLCLNHSDQSDYTDSDGYYSINATPDRHLIWMCGTSGESVYHEGNGFTALGLIPANPSNQGTYAIDMRAGNVSLDLMLNRANARVTVFDRNGQPLPNVQVWASSTGTGILGRGCTKLLVGHPDVCYVGVSNSAGLTDMNGVVEINVLVGLAYQICAGDPDATGIGDPSIPGLRHCLSQRPIVEGANNVIISGANPQAPTVTASQSVTNQPPSISFSTETGVDHYDIYRDGNKIDSIPAYDTYIDSSASNGSRTYSVKAVNSIGGISAPSNTVTIIYDNAGPTINYSISPAINSLAWNNNNVTITFTCDDSLSGTRTCPSPITINTEGADQSVTVSAKDNFGNSSSKTVFVKIDKTPPSVSGVMISAPVILFNGTVIIRATASDSLSGVTKGEFYIDTDPGQGNGTPMTYATNGKLAATTTMSNLTSGQHKVYVRSQDKAGNWSRPIPVTFIYAQPLRINVPSINTIKTVIYHFLWRLVT